MSSPIPPADSSEQPLGMTVHSMPSAHSLASQPETRTRIGRWKMFFVFLVCAAPVVASYTTYYWLRPEGRRNFGDLIEPQRPLPNIMATTLDGRTVPLPSLQSQWLLITVSGAGCDAACEQNLYFQRQLRERMGKHKERMDRVWLITDNAPVRQELLPALQDATVLRVPAAALSQWLEPQAGHRLAEHLYVVDPQGHWMMRFPPAVSLETAPKIKSDLDSLMRGSEGWHKGRSPA